MCLLSKQDIYTADSDIMCYKVGEVSLNGITSPYKYFFFEFNKLYTDQEPEKVMEYLLDKWKESDIKPYSFKETREFIKKEAMYQWWSRCQYEIIISDWPPSGKKEKWDVYRQVMMNLDNIVILFMENLKDYKNSLKLQNN